MVSQAGHYIWVLDRRENPLPFSKFVAASSMIVVGIEPETAYTIAEETEARLLERRLPEIAIEDLMDITTRSIESHLGVGSADRYVAWLEARRRGKPIIVLLGGAPGVGKSSVAGEVGARLRISSVIPTDAVRQVMRQLVADTLAPMLHVSSFEAHQALRSPVPPDHDPVIVGFQSQVDMVSTGVRGLIDRAIKEGTGLVVEGVHMVPGLYDDGVELWSKRAVICQTVLVVSDAEVHRAHFRARAEQATQRSADRYLDAFDEVRRIDRYVQSCARQHGVPIISMEQLDDAIQQVVEMIVDAVIAGAASSEA